jgi:Superinfection immunity protein
MEVIVIGILLLSYLFPWMVAAGRQHHNRNAVLALNLLLGWTFIFWVAALVWALTKVDRPIRAPGNALQEAWRRLT